MLNDILITMALEEESQGLFEKSEINVLYTKIGKVNAAYNLTKEIYRRKASSIPTKLVLNLGTAGSSKFKKDTLVACNKFVQRDMDCTGLGFEHGKTPFDDSPVIIEHINAIKNIKENGLCGSGDSFESSIPKISCDVVDMEAYALAKICKNENINFSAIKYVTDGTDENSANDWNESLQNASKALHNIAINIEEYVKI